MSDNQQDNSIHTQSRAKSSVKRVTYNTNNTHNSNIQMQYFRLKQQAQKEIENCQKEIEELKDELYNKNIQIEHINSTIIVNLKKQIKQHTATNVELFRLNQQQARQLGKLKDDNFKMQTELDKQTRERKNYFSRLDELKDIKQNTKKELLEKDKIIKNYSETNKKLEKKIADFELSNKNLIQEIKDKEHRIFECESEYKAILQKNFVVESQLRSLQFRQNDNQLMLNNYKQKAAEFERQKDQLMEKLDEQESRNMGNSRRGDLDQIAIIEIKSLMDQIYDLMEDKKQQNKHIQKKFLASVTCLEKTLAK